MIDATTFLLGLLTVGFTILFLSYLLSSLFRAPKLQENTNTMTTTITDPVYDTFRANVLALIKRGETTKLNTQEITLLIPVRMREASKLRREYTLRFLQEFPHHRLLFNVTHNYYGRPGHRRKHPHQLDAIFERRFDRGIALTIAKKMRIENLSVHQAVGRLVRERRITLSSGLISRYGVFIHDEWGVGVRPVLKGSKTERVA